MRGERVECKVKSGGVHGGKDIEHCERRGVGGVLFMRTRKKVKKGVGNETDGFRTYIN